MNSTTEERLVGQMSVMHLDEILENQFIYPHVVGSSVGLSALWTLIAALVGGKLFGIVGIIFFIPIVAVLYELVRQWTNTRLAERMAAGELSE